MLLNTPKHSPLKSPTNLGNFYCLRASKWIPSRLSLSVLFKRGSSRPLFGKMENDHLLTSSSLVWAAGCEWPARRPHIPPMCGIDTSPSEHMALTWLCPRCSIFSPTCCPWAWHARIGSYQVRAPLLPFSRRFRVTVDTVVGHSAVLERTAFCISRVLRVHFWIPLFKNNNLHGVLLFYNIWNRNLPWRFFVWK